MRHLWASGLALASALIWSWALVDEPAPWHRSSAVILAATLLVVTTLGVVAILIESSRLGYRLIVAATAIEATVGLLHERSGAWYIGVAMLGPTAFMLADPTLGGWVRRRASAAPVPTRAVSLGMILLAATGICALVTLEKDPGPLGVLTAASWLVLFVYARRLPGALLSARAGPPLLALGTIWLPSPGRWVWLGLMISATYLASSGDVRLAIRPLIERGSRLMIPPELAPEEIRRALDKDS
ncbi:MAG: hypothetical protein ACRDWA_00890 [Acidimicrobiia bacterium]